MRGTRGEDYQTEASDEREADFPGRQTSWYVAQAPFSKARSTHIVARIKQSSLACKLLLAVSASHPISLFFVKRTTGGGGGKGLARSKAPKRTGAGAGAGDDKKLQAALKKLPVASISGVEEVNMFKEGSRILHFSAPKGAPA